MDKRDQQRPLDGCLLQQNVVASRNSFLRTLEAQFFSLAKKDFFLWYGLFDKDFF